MKDAVPYKNEQWLSDRYLIDNMSPQEIAGSCTAQISRGKSQNAKGLIFADYVIF